MRKSHLRAVLSGLLVWGLVLGTFAVFDLVGLVMPLQRLIILSLMPLYALTDAWFLYRKGANLPGWIAGILVTCTALAMDVLVTVPLVEIPKGGSYALFFTDGLLWTLAGMNLTTVLLYWRWRIYPVTATVSDRLVL